MEALMQMCCICIILLAFSLAALVYILFDVYRTFKANGFRWRHDARLTIYGIINQISCLRDEVKLLRENIQVITIKEEDDKN